MGLDVYLYRSPDRKKTKKLEDKYEKESNAIWKRVSGDKPYDQMTEDEKKKASDECDKLKERLGLDDDGAHPDNQKIEIDSKKYPEHMFKVGYLRSSYNGSGFNSYLRRLGLNDLYSIFEPNDRYEFAPDWHEAKERVSKLISDYDAKMTEPIAQYDCLDVMLHIDGKAPKSDEEALALFQKELERFSGDPPGFDSYSNRAGFFSKSGMPVHALIGGISAIGTPAVYAVYKRKTESGDWYRQALEITEEMIDYVLAQPNVGDFYLHWSS